MFYFKDDKQVTVIFKNGIPAVWNNNHPEYLRVIELCKDEKWIEIEALHNVEKMIIHGKVTVEKDGNISVETNYGNITLENKENRYLLSMIKLLQDKGVLEDNIERARPFLVNMMENPYIDAVHEIYEYCTNMDFEITPDGCFLAYKNVRKDLGSVHDGGKTKHVVGQYTEVTDFDTDRNRECSAGLHFAAKKYLDYYNGEVTIIVKVNPKDVVAIPRDYERMKGRCTRYLTVAIIAKEDNLHDINLREAAGEEVIKTSQREAADKVKANIAGKDRLTATKQNMDIYRGNVQKVAKVMGISVETVKRNMRKYRMREDG